MISQNLLKEHIEVKGFSIALFLFRSIKTQGSCHADLLKEPFLPLQDYIH